LSSANATYVNLTELKYAPVSNRYWFIAPA